MEPGSGFVISSRSRIMATTDAPAIARKFALASDCPTSGLPVSNRNQVIPMLSLALNRSCNSCRSCSVLILES